MATRELVSNLEIGDFVLWQSSPRKKAHVDQVICIRKTSKGAMQYSLAKKYLPIRLKWIKGKLSLEEACIWLLEN